MAAYPQSVAYTRTFKMIDSSDHISKKTGLTCTVNISKAGAAFGAAGGSVAEIANGWYKVSLNTTDTNTVGDLSFYITATGADDTDFVDQVTDPVRGLGAPTALPNANAGASGGLLINGSNAGSITLADVTIAGTAASGSTPAKNGLTITGGAASTTGGGTAGVGISVTGGTGAASTNGAAGGATFAGGGTNTVASTATGILTTGTSTGHGLSCQGGGGSTGDGFLATCNATNGNGIKAVSVGTGKDLNAQTTNALQVNTTAVGGTTQTAYDIGGKLGTPAGATFAADLAEIEGETDGIAAIPTSNPSAATIASAVWQDTTAGDFTVSASVGKSVMNGVALGTGLTINAYTGNTVQTGDSYARLGAPVGASISADLAEIEAETDGIAAIPTSNPSAAAIATAVWQDATAGDFTVSGSIGKSLFTSGNAPGAASGLALVGSNMGTVSSVTGSVNSVTTGVTVTTNNDKAGYSLTQAFPTNFSSLSITAAGLVSVTSNRKKGATATFEIALFDSTTGAPKTGLTVTSNISKDGGAPASTTNSVTEIALGVYQIVLTATEMTANNIALVFTATGTVTYILSIQTVP